MRIGCYLVAFSTALLLCACKSTHRDNEMFSAVKIGMDRPQVVGKLGQPTITLDLPGGEQPEVLIYRPSATTEPTDSFFVVFSEQGQVIGYGVGLLDSTPVPQGGSRSNGRVPRLSDLPHFGQFFRESPDVTCDAE